MKKPLIVSTKIVFRHPRAYRIPQQIAHLIQSFFDNFTCRMENGKSSFEVKTGVRQGCLISALFFNSVTDWVMWRTTEDQPRGIRWTLISTLEDLDFADHVALVSHNHQHMQETTARLSTSAQQVGLKISQKKTEVMMLNAQHPAPVKVNGQQPTTEEFTNLGSIVTHDGGAGNDIKNRLGKPRNAFRMKNDAWRLSQYSNKAKRRMYQSFVLSTLLYGSECWRMTECDRNKSSNFHAKYLRRTLRIF